MEQRQQLSIALQSDKSPAAYRELGALVEQYGFGTISVYADLLFQPPLPALLLIAQATTRIRLGPACLNPYTLHPLEIAGQIAMLDAVAGGRTYLGLARGAWLDSLGLHDPHPLTTMREAVAVIQQLLHGERRAFHGKTFHLSPDHQLQYAVERPDIPLLLGTWGRQLAIFAGEVADEVKVGGSANPAFVGTMRHWLAAGSARRQRPPTAVGIAFGAVTVVDTDGAAARAVARREVARYLPVVAPLDPTVTVEPALLQRIATAVDQNDLALASRLVPEELLDRFAFAGTPAQIIDQTAALLAAGATRIEFGTPHGLTAREGLRLLGEVVVPAIAPG